MTNIVPWWDNQDNIHEEISTNDDVLDIGNLHAIKCNPYAQYRKSEYHNRNPENKKRKNPWSLDNHESLVSLIHESVDELGFSRYSEWLKKPRVNKVKWNHIFYCIYFSLDASKLRFCYWDYFFYLYHDSSKWARLKGKSIYNLFCDKK